MNKALEDQIHGMASMVKDTSRIDDLIVSWEQYFDTMNIDDDKQQEEFNGIMRARLFSGCISIAAPDLDALFGSTGK